MVVLVGQFMPMAYVEWARANATVRTFFEKEYDRYSFGYRADGVASIQNKVGAFLADPVLNRILTTSKSDIHVRRVMDDGKILNLAKGRLGEDRQRRATSIPRNSRINTKTP